jgi:hypothetical protein
VRFRSNIRTNADYFLSGPNWIHGVDSNPIMRLAKESASTLCLADETQFVYDQHGTLLETEKIEPLMDLLWSIISDAFKYSNECCSQIPPTESLQDFVVSHLQYHALPDNDKELLLHVAEMWGAFIGDPWIVQSLKYFWLEECLDGGR